MARALSGALCYDGVKRRKGTTMLRRLMTWSLAGAFLALPLLSAPAFAADEKGDKKKKEEEWKKLQKQQKSNKKVTKNPLKKILDLLKDIEDRLVDSDTGEWTQDEQRQVVEALKLQNNAVDELDKLINKIQDQQNQQQNQQNQQNQKQQQKNQKNSKQDQKSQQDQRKNETPEQRRQRQERERRQKEQQRQKQLEKQRQKKQQQAKRQERMKPKKPMSARRDKNDQKRKGKLPPDQQGALRAKNGDARGWGNLPLKLHQDAEKARSEPIPERFRALIEGYRKRIEDKD